MNTQLENSKDVFHDEFYHFFDKYATKYAYIPTINYDDEHKVEKDIVTYMAEKIKDMNYINKKNKTVKGANLVDICVDQRIQDLTVFYNYLNKNFSPDMVSVIPLTDQYPQIIEGLITLYFSYYGTETKKAYIKNLVEKCVKKIMNLNIRELVCNFMKNHYDMYEKLYHIYKLNINMYLNKNDQDIDIDDRQINLLTLVEVDDLKTKLLETITDEFKTIATDLVQTATPKKKSVPVIVEPVIENIKVTDQVKVAEQVKVTEQVKEDSDEQIMAKLSVGIKNLVKDINEPLDLIQLYEISNIIESKKHLFQPKNNENDTTVEANMTLQFKIYYTYNQENNNDTDKENLIKCNNTLFGKNIILDNNMIKYYANNKNKFNVNMAKEIENDIRQSLLKK